MPQIWGPKLQGLEFTSDMVSLSKLKKDTMNKSGLHDYGWCSFGSKFSQTIALHLPTDFLQLGFTPCLGIQSS